MSRRRARKVPELTSLLDVLFILVFATLVDLRGRPEAGAAVEGDVPPIEAADAGAPAADAAARATGPADAGPPFNANAFMIEMQRTRIRAAAARLMSGVRTHAAILVGVASAGEGATASAEIVSIDRQGAGPGDLEIKLLRPSLDQTRKIEYRGATERDDRLCEIVRRELGLRPDLGRALVVVTTDRPFAELPYALVAGMQEDARSCLDDANGFAILLDPGKVAPPGGRDE